jgi:hypothetical protein
VRSAILATLLAMPLVIPLWGARVRGARGGMRRTVIFYLVFLVAYVTILMYMDVRQL